MDNFKHGVIKSVKVNLLFRESYILNDI